MATSTFFSKINSIHYVAEHSSDRTGSWTALEDTYTIAQIHGIPAEEVEAAIERCIRLLKSKNRRSKFFRIVKLVTTREVIKELTLDG